MNGFIGVMGYNLFMIIFMLVGGDYDRGLGSFVNLVVVLYYFLLFLLKVVLVKIESDSFYGYGGIFYFEFGLLSVVIVGVKLMGLFRFLLWFFFIDVRVVIDELCFIILVGLFMELVRVLFWFEELLFKVLGEMVGFIFVNEEEKICL